jgi:hypothetical protein
MGSTEEQLGLLNVIGIDISAYSNVLLSFGFVVFFFAYVLISLWEYLTNYPDSTHHHDGYTQVDREALISSSSFLDHDDQDEDDAVELKETYRRANIGAGNSS